jgi:hypothetical protein
MPGEQADLFHDCAWCSDPAVGEVEVEPAVIRDDPKTGVPKTIKRPIMAGACDVHMRVGDGQGPSIASLRRRKARGVQQASMFDETPDGPGSAIFGDAA